MTNIKEVIERVRHELKITDAPKQLHDDLIALCEAARRPQTDVEWIESVGAQIWPTRKKGQITSWTVQVFLRNHVIQPTQSTLMAALYMAQEEYARTTTISQQ